jgi:hypothetical protein
MKNEFLEYLNSIGITGLFQERAQAIYSFYEKIIADTMQDIFVSDYVNEEGRRLYENLWFFTSSAVFEAKQFLTTDDFDGMPYTKKVKYWRIVKKDYDFNNITSKSRMTIEVGLKNNMGCIMKASGDNCSFLKAIFLKYYLPNLID